MGYSRTAVSLCCKGDVFEPIESRQQAKCACYRLKDGPDA